MGSFYTNITLRDPKGDIPEEVLRNIGRSAYVFRKANDVVVFDQRCEDQDSEELAALADHFSSELKCVTFAVLNHDDSVLWFQVYQDSNLLAEYASKDGPRTDIRALCHALNRSEAWLQVWFTLRRPYIFETNRHAALVRIFGIPEAAVGFGWTYIERGELPPGITIAELVRV
jgi:hypothetical protein